MILLGIDPGLSGALAFYNTANGQLDIFDMPTLIVGAPKRRKAKPGKKATTTQGKSAIDEAELARILEERRDYVDHAFLEHVNAMPSIPDKKTGERRSMGAASAFAFGEGYGLVKGILAAYALRRTLVYPQAWKKALGLNKAKDAAVKRACEIFPNHAAKFRGPKGGLLDGRAESSLITYYGAIAYGAASR